MKNVVHPCDRCGIETDAPTLCPSCLLCTLPPFDQIVPRRHTEIGGKTLTGREHREWYVGMKSNVDGRECEIIRFNKRGAISRVLVRWLKDGAPYDTRMIYPLVGKGRTQWIGLYQIEPEVSVS